MRTTILLLSLIAAAPLIAAGAAPRKPAKNAAAKESRKAPNPTVYDAVRIWDKDGNRQIEGGEAEPLRTAVAEATGGVIKSLDADADGKLGDAELAAMNAGLKAPPEVAASPAAREKKKGKKQQ